MSVELSPPKITRILRLYFEGFPQVTIAEKQKVNQATVSLYISKFTAMAELEGLETAAKEYGIMDIVKELHSLGAECKKSGLSVEDAKVGLKMLSPFQKLGVEVEDYQDVIQAATKLKAEGFLESAVKLNKLGESTGMTHEEIVVQSANTYQQLKNDQQDLEIVTGTLNAAKEDLVAIENQKQLASQDLQAHMQQIGVDMNRLSLVEELAATLKKAGVSNEALKDYIQRQQLLNEVGISIDILASILEKAGVVIHKDHGKALLQMLTEYGGLSEANQSLNLKINSLEKEVAGLEEKAKLKGKIGAEIAELKAEKASLEPHVVKLHDQKDLMDKVKSEVSSLTEKKAGLVQEIAGLEASKASMSDKIKSLEETTNDLEERKAEYDAVSASLSEVEGRLAREKKRLQIFDSFLGFVRSSSVDKLETFADDAAYFVEDVKKGNHSPQLIRNMLIQNLTEGTLQVLRCTSCEVKFVVDKQPLTSGADYYCPLCGMTYPVKVDKDALVMLHEGLVELNQFQTIIIQPKLISPQEHKNKLDNGGK